MKPKAFFVGDNRNSSNWGRGASIALRELLESSFEICGTVSSEWFDIATAKAGYVGSLMPGRYSRHLHSLMRRRSRRSVRWYIALEELWGARDFISEDPAESVNNLLDFKDRIPELGQLYDQAAESDLVVVDGDGDIIFSTPPRRTALFFLAMIALADRLKKPAFLVNSMISDCPETGRNEQTLRAYRQMLAKCKAVTLRDPASLEYVQKEMPEVKASQIPDSLFSWYGRYQYQKAAVPANGDFVLPFPEKAEYWGKLDFSEPYVCVGGGALASAYPERALESYLRLVDAVGKLGYKVILTENDLPDSFVYAVAAKRDLGVVPANTSILMCGAILANARLFISGRYHPSILASLGGTPCIFLGTHSHKCSSISRVLDYETQREFSAFPDGGEIEGIISLAQRYLNQGEGIRSRIREVARARCAEAQSLPALLMRHLNG